MNIDKTMFCLIGCSSPDILQAVKKRLRSKVRRYTDMTDTGHRSMAKMGEWEGDEPHYSSLFFSTWVGFVFLWRSWLLIEVKD